MILLWMSDDVSMMFYEWIWITMNQYKFQKSYEIILITYYEFVWIAMNQYELLGITIYQYELLRIHMNS